MIWFNRRRDLVTTAASLRDKFYVIVGGGPVTPEFARTIGADGWAGNAVSGSRVCEQLMTSGHRPPLANPICSE
jgi:hypothetical protein